MFARRWRGGTAASYNKKSGFKKPEADITRGAHEQQKTSFIYKSGKNG
jgi:hypothetical protein